MLAFKYIYIKNDLTNERDKKVIEKIKEIY